MARDLRQTILSRIDPDRVTVPIDVDTLSTASGTSSIPLPFPTLNPMDQQKKDVTHQKKAPTKKKDDEAFASPAPRPPTEPSVTPKGSMASSSIVDSEKKANQKNTRSEFDGDATSDEHRPFHASPPIEDVIYDQDAHGVHDALSQEEHGDPRRAFALPSPNKTPAKHDGDKNSSSPIEEDKEPVVAPHQPMVHTLERNPIKALAQRTFRPQGALPTGFPEPRDITKDVQGGKIPVKGQNRFSKVDVLSTTPTIYHDTSPLPPPDLLAALNPAPQILLFGDGLPYNGFLKIFSIADLANFEWNKLIGLVSFAILPNYAPFQDEPPFFSHRTIVKQIVAMLRAAKKQDKPTTFWLAYNARSNVADVELASVLDRRIDLVPSLGFLWLSVVCQVVHMGVLSPNTHHVSTAPTPLDQPLVLFQLTSSPLPRNHIPQTIGYFPKNVDPSEPIPPTVHTPQSTLFQVRVDVPIDITREVDGLEVKWHISGSLPLMLMLNGLNPDDTSTVLKELTVPRITKAFWPIMVNSAPDGYKLFDFFVPFDVLGNFYDEQPALMDMGVSIGLLDRSVKESALIITHQPRFQKNGPRRRKLPSDEVRTAVELNPPLYRKFAFLVLLNKYDVLGMVHDPMLIQPAVQEIENLGEMICVSAHTNNRVFAKDFSREVSPPYVIARYPPTLDVRDVLKSASTYGPVESHQVFQQSGQVMVKYQALESAATAYGATMPGPIYFSSGNSSQDLVMSLTDRLERVKLITFPQPALTEANLTAAASPLPDFRIPDIASASHPTTVPSAPPSTSSFL